MAVTTRVRSPGSYLPKSGWKRWLAIVLLVVGGFVLSIIALVVSVIVAWNTSPTFQGWALEQMITRGSQPFPDELPENPGPKPTYQGRRDQAADLRSGAEIYRVTNVWDVRLRFTAPQWDALKPKRVQPLLGFMQPDGTPLLRNTNSTRNGLSGVLGFDFPFSSGDVEFGGRLFTDAGVRFKGNGTFLGSFRGYRKPWKIVIDHEHKGRELAGRSTFNLANLSADLTCLSDTLGYEYFRDAGVPSPATALSRVFLSIAGTESDRLLGMYLLVENPDPAWAKERFGKKGVALFKPVTHQLFSDLGDDWAAYDGIYDPKTKLAPEQKARVIEVAKFASKTDDAAFAARIADFVDFDEFARFLAGQVLLSNYDSFLSNGQNYLMYLHPDSKKFGFIPWDLDHCWGEFPHIGTADERTRASIWHPWTGPNRFLERMLAVPAFKERYRQELERQLATVFVPERLVRRVDEIAAVMRPLITEWSPERLSRFETAVASDFYSGPRDGGPEDRNRPVWQLKRFIAERAANVRAQLDGKAEGVMVSRQQQNRRDGPETKDR